MNNIIVTSAQLNHIKVACLTLIGDLRNAQFKRDAINNEAQAAKIDIIRREGESEIALLARIAASATELEQDQLKREALEKIQQATQGIEQPITGPRSKLGRVFGKLAAFAG